MGNPYNIWVTHIYESPIHGLSMYMGHPYIWVGDHIWVTHIYGWVTIYGLPIYI